MTNKALLAAAKAVGKALVSPAGPGAEKPKATPPPKAIAVQSIAPAEAPAAPATPPEDPAKKLKTLSSAVVGAKANVDETFVDLDAGTTDYAQAFIITMEYQAAIKALGAVAEQGEDELTAADAVMRRSADEWNLGQQAGEAQKSLQEARKLYDKAATAAGAGK